MLEEEGRDKSGFEGAIENDAIWGQRYLGYKRDCLRDLRGSKTFYMLPFKASVGLNLRLMGTDIVEKVRQLYLLI